MTTNEFSDAEVASIFQRLRDLKSQLRGSSNKYDVAVVLAAACIDEGLNEGPRIVGALIKLGVNQAHAGIVLSRHTGTDPTKHYWTKDDQGFYHPLPGAFGDPAPS